MSISLRIWLAPGLLAILLLVGACGATEGGSVAQGDPARGLSLWVQSACVGCHGVDAQGSTAGPALADTPLTLAEIIDITRRGGPGMPDYSASQISDQDLQHMYAWFQTPVLAATAEPGQPTLTAEPGQPSPAVENGQDLWTQSGCGGCHGANAEGASAMALAGTSLPYAGFQAVVRQGAQGMPAFSESRLSDQGLQEVYAWLQAQGQGPDVQETVWVQSGCSGCHGANAEGASATALAGRRVSYEEFQRVVRGGEEGMPAYSTSRVSDADLRNLYDWLVALP